MGSGWRSILLAVVAAFVLGCMSPTLPLPPPAAPSESAGPTAGTVHLHGPIGGAEANALLIIRNNYPNPSENLDLQHQATITIVAQDGSWDADVYAVKGDVLNIWQEFGNNDESPSIDFTVN